MRMDEGTAPVLIVWNMFGFFGFFWFYQRFFWFAVVLFSFFWFDLVLSTLRGAFPEVCSCGVPCWRFWVLCWRFWVSVLEVLVTFKC